MISVCVLRLGGDWNMISDLEPVTPLSVLMEKIETVTGIPPVQQKLVLHEKPVPRTDTASMQELGIMDGTRLTLVRMDRPVGLYLGVYLSRPDSPYSYECELRCDRWAWLDDEMSTARFEVAWKVIKHPGEALIGPVGIEVIEGTYDADQRQFLGAGVSMHMQAKEGCPEEDMPFVGSIIGLSQSVQIDFAGDTATYYVPQDNCTMIMKLLAA